MNRQGTAWCAHCGSYTNHDPYELHHRSVDDVLSTDGRVVAWFAQALEFRVRQVSGAIRSLVGDVLRGPRIGRRDRVTPDPAIGCVRRPAQAGATTPVTAYREPVNDPDFAIMSQVVITAWRQQPEAQE
jgi:hypothetical protein